MVGGVVPIAIRKRIDLIILRLQMVKTPGPHGLYFRTKSVKIKDLPPQKPRPLLLCLGVLVAETTLPVSASGDSCYHGQCSYGLGENTGDARQEASGPAVASRSTCRYHCVIHFLLTPISYGERPQGPSAWGCNDSHRCPKGGYRWIRSSQSHPRNHLRRLYESRSSFTTSC